MRNRNHRRVKLRPAGSFQSRLDDTTRSIRFVEDGTGSGRPLNVADVRWTVDGTEYRFSSVGPMNDEVLKVLKSLRAVH